MLPVVAPEGDLGFLGRAKLPFNFINSLRFTSCTANWGVGYAIYKKNLEILSKGISDVAAGCSKHW
jgi:hypothetical protein